MILSHKRATGAWLGPADFAACFRGPRSLLFPRITAETWLFNSKDIEYYRFRLVTGV
jgi:hypothetical protein